MRLRAGEVAATVVRRLLVSSLGHPPRKLLCCLDGEWLVGGSAGDLLLQGAGRRKHGVALGFEELEDGGDELLVHLLTLLGGYELLQELFVDHPELDVLALEHVHLAEDVRLRVDESIEGPRNL